MRSFLFMGKPPPANSYEDVFLGGTLFWASISIYEAQNLALREMHTAIIMRQGDAAKRIFRSLFHRSSILGIGTDGTSCPTLIYGLAKRSNT
jgi:hypothetical protein